MRRPLVKKILNKVYKPVIEKYLDRERRYVYDGLKIKILPGVFHPGIFFSTKILLKHLEKIELKNKQFLELGAGCGLISLVAAKKGAQVTATDISNKAIENISLNAKSNHQQVEIIHSDLFQNMKQKAFDIIVINPPYYKGKIQNEDQHAWYAGEQLEYFQRLFLGLPSYMVPKSNVMMILSDDCEVEQIQAIATSKKIKMNLVYTKKVFWETNFIYELKN